MIKTDLKFTCPDSGVTFELCPIPPLNFDDFNNAYDELYPPPSPPLTEINIAGKLISQPDSRDPHFQTVYKSWESKKEAASRHFMFAVGVLNDPPKQYTPNNSLYAGELPPGKRKALWVSDQLKTVNDIKCLIEAIQSINGITETGLEESKKDIERSLAGSISSNGQSNPTPTPSALTIP